VNLAELLEIPAEIFPDQEILRFDGEKVSYADLQERATRRAADLGALGIRPGDRVAVIETNTPAVIETLLASAMVGAVFVPLNFRAREGELAHMVRVAQPCLLLAGDRYRETAEQISRTQPSSPRVIGLAAAPGEVASLGGVNDTPATHPPSGSGDDGLAVLMFTSGTSAAAKAVMLAHEDLTAFVFNTTEPADGTDRGSVLISAPLYHIAGLTGVLTAVFAGRRIVLLRQFEALDWLETVEREQITHAFLVPTMMRRVLDCPRFADTNLSSLRVLSYGAAPMPVPLIRRAIASFPPSVQFLNAFGQTETTSTVTVLGPADHRLDGTPEEIETKLRRLASIGQPLPDVELSVLDESGRSLGPNQVGEIAIRSGRVMRGYYGADEATNAALQDGWLRTRDLGWIDEGGYVFLAGRQSDMIIRGGENIAPEEVEVVLESHPAVEEAAVVGVADEEWGERVVAVVVTRPGVDVRAEELVEYCRERLASYKKPETVFFSEALPRNALGKLLRQELRVQLADQVAGGSGGERNR
jgi:acyl-CoA synthetase (AMP-forming)/AMP-acid ligase II